MLKNVKRNMCFSLKLSLKYCFNGKRIKTDQMLSREHGLSSISSYNRVPSSFIKRMSNSFLYCYELVSPNKSEKNFNSDEFMSV